MGGLITAAVTRLKALLAASGGAELLGYIQAGVGAVLRNIQDRLRETVSVKDFGAVGDGVADDTAAIIAAIASLPDQGTPTWRPWKLVFPPGGTYRVTSGIVITDQQGGGIEGTGAKLIGNFDGTVLTISTSLWFSSNGLHVQQLATSANAKAVVTEDIYSCSLRDMVIVGGDTSLTVDGNNNMFDNVVVRAAQSVCVKLMSGANNEVNTFVGGAVEQSLGYGVDGRVSGSPNGCTHFDSTYFEVNALGNLAFSNASQFTIDKAYFNLSDDADGIILSGGVGPLYPSGGSDLGVLKSTSGGWGRVTNCRVLGGTASQFIVEADELSSNVAYSNNIVTGGVCDLYGAAPKSINLDRRHRAPYIANAEHFTNTDATGAPDDWTLAGSGNVSAVAPFSPYGGGAGVQISSANSYIHQTITVPANALMRVAVYAKIDGPAAVAALQLWSAGLGAQLKAASTTFAGATRLELFLSAEDRATATSFELVLRNTGAGDNALFCDIELEDMTN